jgi:hypothetical protein
MDVDEAPPPSKSKPLVSKSKGNTAISKPQVESEDDDEETAAVQPTSSKRPREETERADDEEEAGVPKAKKQKKALTVSFSAYYKTK